MTMLRDMASYMKSGESPDHNLGLEIEHFIVNEKGNQIGFDEISGLIRDIGNQIGAEIHYMDGYPVGYYTGEYSTSLSLPVSSKSVLIHIPTLKPSVESTGNSGLYGNRYSLKGAIILRQAEILPMWNSEE